MYYKKKKNKLLITPRTQLLIENVLIGSSIFFFHLRSCAFVLYLFSLFRLILTSVPGCLLGYSPLMLTEVFFFVYVRSLHCITLLVMRTSRMRRQLTQYPQLDNTCMLLTFVCIVYCLKKNHTFGDLTLLFLSLQFKLFKLYSSMHKSYNYFL